MSEESDNLDRRARVRPRGQNLIKIVPESETSSCAERERIKTSEDDDETDEFEIEDEDEVSTDAFADVGGHVLTSIPPWVFEAEEMYLTGKLPTIKAVAARWGHSKSVVGEWCKRRRWVERKAQRDDKAARVLEEKIDEMAVRDAVDLFAEMDRGVIMIGGAALRMLANHVSMEQQKQRQAMEEGRQHTWSPFPKELRELVSDARAMRPSRREAPDAFEDFASLLNSGVDERDAD